MSRNSGKAPGMENNFIQPLCLSFWAHHDFMIGFIIGGIFFFQIIPN